MDAQEKTNERLLSDLRIAEKRLDELRTKRHAREALDLVTKGPGWFVAIVSVLAGAASLFISAAAVGIWFGVMFWFVNLIS